MIEDGDDDLGSRPRIARDVVDLRDVIDDLDLARARARAADAAIEVDPKAPERSLVGADGQRAIRHAPVEAAPVRLRERLPEETGDRGFERDGIQLAVDRGLDLRDGCVEALETSVLGEQRATLQGGKNDAFVHGLAHHPTTRVRSAQMAAALVSKRKFDEAHPDALAVYCSDGRFTDAVEDLLESLGRTRLDTMTLPGGPALFELTTADFAGLEAMRTAASFLVRGHGIKHVVLLAHEGCGYYRSRNPGAESQALIEKQVTDLRGAARWFHGAMPQVDIRLYYARISKQGHVAFHVVEER